MQSFTKSLIELVLSGQVDQEVAANAATNRHDFMVTLERSLKQQKAEQKAEEREHVEEQQQEVEEELPTLRLAQAGD
jgi:hypothetical protein